MAICERGGKCKTFDGHYCARIQYNEYVHGNIPPHIKIITLFAPNLINARIDELFFQSQRCTDMNCLALRRKIGR